MLALKSDDTVKSPISPFISSAINFILALGIPRIHYLFNGTHMTTRGVDLVPVRSQLLVLQH